ncbi:MAG: BON domain-containing protein [Bdellovibrionales bacterium]|nr:BON domain-containing protein [Bdellovibrionales bacterium]
MPRSNSNCTGSKGDYSGRGPKGWRRSDESIYDHVCECLEDHPDIDASDISVKVKGGVVFLAGRVDHRSTKRLAEDVVVSVAGVKDVRNELLVDESFFDHNEKNFHIVVPSLKEKKVTNLLSTSKELGFEAIAGFKDPIDDTEAHR